MSGHGAVPRSLFGTTAGRDGIAPALGEAPHGQRLAGEARRPQLPPELLGVVTAFVPAAAEIRRIRLDTPGRCRPRLPFRKGAAPQRLAGGRVGDPQARGNRAGGETLLLQSEPVVRPRPTPFARVRSLF